MKLRTGLGLAAAAVALAFAPQAGAVTPIPGPTFTFAAETLAGNNDTAQMPAFNYTNTEFMPNGTIIIFTLPTPALTFTNFATNTYSNTPVNVGATPTTNSGVCNGLGNANTVAATNTTITCVVNAPNFGQANNNAGGGGSFIPVAVNGTFTIRLAGVNGANGVGGAASPFAVSGLTALDNPATLATALSFGANGIPTAQILAQTTAAGNGTINGAQPVNVPTTSNPAITDPTPVPWIVLQSRPLISLNPVPATLRIDLTANGLGRLFRNVGQPNDVSTAGFFGTLVATENILLNATTGLNINSQTSSFTTANGATLGVGFPPPGVGQNVQTTPSLPNFNFFLPNGGQATPNQQQSTTELQGIVQGAIGVTISGNFPTIANAFAVQGGNSTVCNASMTAGGNIIGGTVTTSSIAFTLTAPGTNPATNTNQASAGTTEYSICLVTNGTQVIQPTGGNALTQPPNTLNNQNPVTIAANATLGTGVQFPLLPGNTAFSTIQFNGTAYYFENVFGAANLYPSFFRVINPTANTVTVFAIMTKDFLTAGSANTAAPGGLPFFGTVAGTGGAVTVLQPNDATYVSADQVAVATGQLPEAAGLSKATVWLMSPTNGFRASMLAQSSATGDLINLQ